MDSLRIKERRYHTRFPLALSVKCSDKKSHTEILSRTYDISHQGIGLLVNEELPLGNPVDLIITMPDTGEEITVKGKIIWQNPVDNYCYRVGVTLVDSELKPVPIALRTLQARANYH